MLQTGIQITNLNGETTCWILKPVPFLLLSWVSNLRGRRVYQADQNLLPILQEGLSGYSTSKSRESLQPVPSYRETSKLTFYMNFVELKPCLFGLPGWESCV